MYSARPNLERVFGTLDDNSRYTLGYEDRSRREQATTILKSLDDDSRSALHTFAEKGIQNVLQFCGHLYGLIDGLDKNDPMRNRENAVRLAADEIERARRWFSAFHSLKLFPMLVVEHTATDGLRPHWVVVSAQSNKDDPVFSSPPFDQMLDHISARYDYSSDFMRSGYGVLGEVIYQEDQKLVAE